MPSKPTHDPLRLVRESLVRNIYTDSEYLASDIGRKDLADHLENRLTHNRQRVVPWLLSFLPLDGTQVLEIGCGTGASTLALTECGAVVTAIDIRPDSIQVASDRCQAYGHKANFVVANAAALGDILKSKFEAVVFYAALEHMTYEERRAAMRDTWQSLAPGAYWIVVDTPNRLWYSDTHTSFLPFFNWLPDQLAFEYSRFSPREYFRELYDERTPEKELDFLRRGRGLSFHEFELYLAPRQELEVVSCLSAYWNAYWNARTAGEVQNNSTTKVRWKALLGSLRARRQAPCSEDRDTVADSGDDAWRKLLGSAVPDLHPAFLEPYLDLAIRKSRIPGEGRNHSSPLDPAAPST